MDKTAFTNKDILGYFFKYCKDPSLDCYQHLFVDSIRKKTVQNAINSIPNLTNYKRIYIL